LSSTVAVPILAELVFRLAIALELPSARNPSLYADHLSEDDYFKLAVAWGHTRISERLAHPLLGWAPPVTPSNPLGIIRSAPYEVIRERPVLFFGDSYVAGATGAADGIPHHLERLLDGHAVYNYGVSGYGVDQIVLRVETAVDRFRDPVILVGILTDDVDRTVLRFRGAPKPRFVMTKSGLKLEGTPVSADFAGWLERNPVRIRSYLGAYLRRRLAQRRSPSPTDDGERRVEKEQLTRALLARLATASRSARFQLAFVLFYGPRDLCHEGWRERFLKQELRHLGVSVLDSKPVLLSDSGGKCDPARHYLAHDGHFSSFGNAFIARWLAPFVERLLDQGAR
jgi:hypothetical protein